MDDEVREAIRRRRRGMDAYVSRDDYWADTKLVADAADPPEYDEPASFVARITATLQVSQRFDGYEWRLSCEVPDVGPAWIVGNRRHESTVLAARAAIAVAEGIRVTILGCDASRLEPQDAQMLRRMVSG